MYLSQLILNPRSRQVRSELARPYELHRTVMSGFAGKAEDERVLYRLDLSQRDGIPVLLVQSHNPPDWSALQAKRSYFLAGTACENPAVRQFSPQPGIGQCFAFRLLANPTRSTKEGVAVGKRGKRVSIRKEEDQVAWLASKAMQGGFKVLSLRVTVLDHQAFDVPAKPKEVHDLVEREKEEKKRHTVHYEGVRFDGVLEVLDTHLFEKTLMQGIGSAKGFGYGLLSVARL